MASPPPLQSRGTAGGHYARLAAKHAKKAPVAATRPTAAAARADGSWAGALRLIDGRSGPASYNSLLQKCGAADAWEAALSVLGAAAVNGLEVGVVLHCGAIGAVQKSGAWTAAVELGLGLLRTRPAVALDAFAYGVVMNAFSACSALWRDVLRLLGDMTCKALETNVVVFTTVLTSVRQVVDGAKLLLGGASRGEWRCVGSLLDSMRRCKKSRPNAVTCSVAVGCLSTGSLWTTAAGLLSEASMWSVERDVVVFASAAGAMQETAQWHVATGILEKADMVGLGITPLLASATAGACGAARRWEAAAESVRRSFTRGGGLLQDASFSVNPLLTACVSSSQWVRASRLFLSARQGRCQMDSYM
eukprot:TRINITY_DN30042_c0_g4_i3.p1 TRINITY_DN30042_c0_g4~~TRINITY_DN30042_c0_g4_i3.p1  ORF type:complete len:362 (-),score=57.65 TRINITY_DN30042_c0_g4_i3:154-1239(-)